MMKKRFNRKGFTLAEVLIVVAIIVVLASVGAVALFSHMRNMQKLEMDGQAKELFVAAQNHLSLASSQGFLGVAEYTETGGLTDNFGTAETDGDGKPTGIYYIIVNDGDTFGAGKGKALLNQMLPFASMDEVSRVGGSYIIRYQKEPAQILDVFYVARSGRFGLKEDEVLDDSDYSELMDYLKQDDLKEKLMKYKGNLIVGYYGGTDAASLKSGDPLDPPEIEVINGKTLYVTVKDPNYGSTGPNGGENTLQLVVTGKTSHAQKVFTLVRNGTDEGGDRISGAAANYEVLLDSVTGALNDHFSKLTASTGDFLPGENLEVKAISMNNKVLTNIAESATVTTNSLFADLSGSTAEIANFRHLLNLDETYVSGLNGSISVTKAKQTDNLDWNEQDPKTKEYIWNTSSINLISGTGDGEGKFYPVTVGYKLEYDGGSHQISGIDVATSDDGGLFRSLAAESSVHDLELVNFKIAAGGDAGALAGSLSGVSIRGVLARNIVETESGSTEEKTDADYGIQSTGGAAGGLVGTLNGGSVVYSAAAVYVDGKNNAGGLIGAVTDSVTIAGSYSGGHTVGAEYKAAADTELLTGNGRVNVYSAAGNAGGLVGDATSAALNVEYSYSTASAMGDKAVGGLLGQGGSRGEIKYCYAVGRVYGGGDRYAFIGDADGQTLSAVSGVYTNYYLENITDGASQSADLQLIGAFAGDTSYPEFLLPDKTDDTNYEKRAAVVYDKDLGGRYDFPTVAQLYALNEGTSAAVGFGTSITQVHYGDWQMPTMEILHYTLVNSDTLFTDVTLKDSTHRVTLALYGETSKQAVVYLIDVDGTDDGARTIIDKGTLKEVSGQTVVEWADEAPAAGTPLPASMVSTATVGENKVKTLRVTLDDITTAEGHFASVFPGLIPGENVTLLVAGGKCGWADLDSLRIKRYADDTSHPQYDQIIALSDNSLYAKPEALEAKEATKSYESGEGGAPSEYVTVLTRTMSDYPAEIRTLRHLQNLDTSVSNVNTDSALITAGKYIKTAKLMDSINLETNKYESIESFTADPNKVDWSVKKIYLYTSTTGKEKGTFNGIYNKQLISFDGNDKTIVGLKFGDTEGSHPGNAGLFRYVDQPKLNIEHLRLANLSVSDSGNAGAFIAEVATGSEVTLRSVLAMGNEADVAASVAGGLVGKSSGTLKIVNSAASVYVDGSSAAGGLLGLQSSGAVEIRDSYVGGHTNEGVYYTGDGAGRWNIISTSGAAGGLIGKTEAGTAAIRQSFNAASVYAGDNLQAGGVIGVAGGSFSSGFSAIPAMTRAPGDTSYGDGYPAIAADAAILNLVYVVAPVNSVGAIVNNEGAYSVVGSSGSGNGSGSVMGFVDADDLANSGLYFLPDVYLDPMPAMLDGEGHSNIIPIGKAFGSLSEAELEAILKTAKPASTYVGVGNDEILGIAGEQDHLEQATSTFDRNLRRFEYPFAIWTNFNFGTDGMQLYYYGDWQRMPHVSNIHLHIHFVASLPADDGTRFNKSIEDEEVILQIPYTPTKFDLLYAPDPSSNPEYYDYQFNDSLYWYMYEGDGTKTTSLGSSIANFNRSNSGGQETLTAELFQQINIRDNYVKEDGITKWSEGDEGDPHLHITLVAEYKKREGTLHVLRFFDQDPETGAYPTEPNTFLVVENDSTEDSQTLSKLMEDVEEELPSYTKTGYRLTGWYNASSSGTQIYNNAYHPKTPTDATGDNHFHLELVGGNTEVAKDVLYIDLYSRYRPIQMRNIHLHFTTPDTEDNKVPNIEDCDIYFEADRGFYSSFKLASGGGLTPTSITNPDGSAVTDDSAVMADAQLTFNIPYEEDELTTDELTVGYNVVYRVTGLESEGYVIICEKMKTDSNGAYDAAQSYIVPNPYLTAAAYPENTFGATKPGEVPSPSYDAIPAAYFTDCGIAVNTEFVPYGMKILTKDDSGNFVDGSGNVVIPADSVSAKNIPPKVTATAPDETEAKEYDVNYVVLLQYSRKTYQLKIDTNGCTTKPTYYDPFVEFGTDIYSYLTAGGYYITEGDGALVRPGYAFTGWTYPGGDVKEKKPTMPAADLTVTAQWLGAPTGFTVLFMTQSADDADEYSVSGYVKYADPEESVNEDKDLQANAGTTFTFSDSGVLTWHYDADLTNGYQDNLTRDETYVDVTKYFAEGDSVSEIFQYFELNAEETREQNKDREGNDIVVRDDGNTTYKIYFDRKIYTLRFDVVFSEWSGYGYKPLTDKYVDNKINDVYGSNKANPSATNDNDYFPLIRSGSDWGYYAQEKIYYDGTRYKTLPDNRPEPAPAGPGGNAKEYVGVLSDGTVVTLTYETTRKTGRTEAIQYYTASGNTGTQYGIVNNNVQQVYYNNNRWRITNTRDGARYRGDRFFRNEEGRIGEEYTGSLWYAVGTGTDNNNQSKFTQTKPGGNPQTYGSVTEGTNTYYFKVGTVDVTVWKNAVSGQEYTGQVYVSDAGDAANHGVVNGKWIELTKEAPNRWYYMGDSSTFQSYTGTKYIKGGTGNETLYIGRATNAYNSATDNYFNFLASNRQQITSFDRTGLKAYDVYLNNKAYTIYYMDLTARYGSSKTLDGKSFYNEWPAYYENIRYNNTNYYFVGWIQSDRSKLAYDQIQSGSSVPSSLKGKYRTMSDILLLIDWKKEKWNKIYTGTNHALSDEEEASIYDTVSINENTKIPNNDANAVYYTDGIAQEFHCRWSSGTPNRYTYRYYFEDPDDGQFRQDPDIPNVTAQGGSGSYPIHQTPTAFDGYQAGKAYLDENGRNEVKASDRHTSDPMNIYFRYSLNRWKLVLENEGWANSTRTYDGNDRLRFGQSLAFIGTDDDLAIEPGTEMTIGGKTKTFDGWYTTPGGETGTKVDVATATMPDGVLTLYAVWRDAPSDVKFELTPKYWSGTVVNNVPGVTGGDLEWPKGKPATEGFQFNDVPNGYTLLQQDIEWEKYEPELDGWEFRYWGDGQGNPFSVDQPIVTDLTLYPYFDKKQDTGATINISYVYGGAEQPASLILPALEQKDVNFGETFSWTPPVIDGYRVDPPVVPPTFMSAERLKEAPFSYDEEKKEYNLVFTYSETTPEWTYSVGYYLRLTPYGGGAAEEIPLMMEDAPRQAAGDFTFAQFYAIPEALSAYEFQSVEVWKTASGSSDIHVAGYDTTDATILLKRGDGNKVKVFLQIDPKTILPDNRTTTYNGKSQGITISDLDFSRVYLPTGDGAITVNDPYCTYYNGTTRISGAPKNAGLYGVEIDVTVTHQGKEYWFWQSDRISAGKKPAVTYRINRCIVYLESGGITNVFYRNSANASATLPSGTMLAPSGYVARNTDEVEFSCNEQELMYIEEYFSYGFSADAFRRAPSQYGTFDEEGNRDPNGTVFKDDYTPNVFSYQVSSELDLNNFSIYKIYGKLYIWNSVDDYTDWLKDNPATGG